MRNKCKLKVIILVVGIIFTLSSYSKWTYIDTQLNKDIAFEFKNEHNLKTPKSSGFWTTNFIHVDGNWSYTVGNYSWCSGDGSFNNPYTIENVTIDASSSPTGSGIFINNSKNDYFIIRNCTMYNGGSELYDAGIRLENTNNGYLINNNCSSNLRSGILLNNICQNNNISGNIANDNDWGIILMENCEDNILVGNTANYSTSGIGLIDGCDNNLIRGNTANNNSYWGIFLRVGNNNRVSQNTANNNNQYGIYLYNDCNNNIISENTAGNIGTLYQYVGIFLKRNSSNNIILENIVNNNFYYGIYLHDYCNNNTISGNSASNTGTSNQDDGIHLLNDCDNNTISGNIVSNNIDTGISLLGFCDNNTISANILNDNIDFGIRLNTQCDNNTITENIAYENGVGIQLEADCYDNLLFYNYLVNNSINNGYDLGLNNWDNGTIGNYWDNYNGIDIDHNGIGDTPFEIPGGTNNNDNKPMMIYKALFFKSPCDLTYEVGVEGHDIVWVVINPTLHTLTFNVFKDGSSIKTGYIYPMIVDEIFINVDSLGVGVYGYTIEVDNGNGGSFTNGLWVTVTNTAPIFTVTPTDFSYEVGEIGNNISWTFSDVSTNNPTYTISRNGVPILISNPCASDVPIVIAIDGLEVGSHGFTIEVDDGYGEIVLDSVWITVDSIPEPTILDILFIEIVDQSFSIEEFNVTFFVYNATGQGIVYTVIQLWWNEIDVSANIQSLGNGLYFIVLEPITVDPGEDPILLEIEISAPGYQNKSFNTYLAVDPDTLDKDLGGVPDDLPLIITITIIASIAAGVGVTGTTLFILRKRKHLSE